MPSTLSFAITTPAQTVRLARDTCCARSALHGTHALDCPCKVICLAIMSQPSTLPFLLLQCCSTFAAPAGIFAALAAQQHFAPRETPILWLPLATWDKPNASQLGIEVCASS